MLVPAVISNSGNNDIGAIAVLLQPAKVHSALHGVVAAGTSIAAPAEACVTGVGVP